MQQVCYGAKIKATTLHFYIIVSVNLVLILVLTVKALTPHAQNTPCMETAHNTFPLRRFIQCSYMYKRDAKEWGVILLHALNFMKIHTANILSSAFHNGFLS